MRALILLLALTTIVPSAIAQTSQPAAPYARFKQNASAAVTAERAREKLNLCRTPKDAIEQVTCPANEFDLSTKNYLQLARAIGGLLRLYMNSGDSKEDHTNAETIGKDFDAAESTWAKYREAECVTVTDDQYPDATNGHPWAYGEVSCKLAVTRHHIYELDAVYGWLWKRCSHPAAVDLDKSCPPSSARTTLSAP